MVVVVKVSVKVEDVVMGWGAVAMVCSEVQVTGAEMVGA